MSTPYPLDSALQPEPDRTAQFLVVFRAAIMGGFYPEVFAGMSDKDVAGVAANYIANGTENLTIFDGAFLEALYGTRATSKAHWLIELRMRRMDIVPALWKDLQRMATMDSPVKP